MSESENHFEPPAAESTPPIQGQVALHSVLLVFILGLLFVPTISYLAVADGWRRLGRRDYAVAWLIAAVVSGVVIQAGSLFLTVAFGGTLVVFALAAGAAALGQSYVRRAAPSIRRANIWPPLILGFILWLLLRQMGPILWVLTGNAAFQPY